MGAVEVRQLLCEKVDGLALEVERDWQDAGEVARLDYRYVLNRRIDVRLWDAGYEQCSDIFIIGLG